MFLNNAMLKKALAQIKLFMCTVRIHRFDIRLSDYRPYYRIDKEYHNRRVSSQLLFHDISEPSLSMPITVGLYAKWGSGKSFLLSKLRYVSLNFKMQNISF